MSNNPTIEVRDLREQDWIWTSTAVLFHPEINGNTYKTYCGLASYANNNSQKAFPSTRTLAMRLHMGRSTIIRGLETLEKIGAISVERTKGEHNIYFLLKIAGDFKPAKAPKIPEQEAKENWVKQILEWAEKRRNSKFVVYGKQVGALGLMQKSDYTPREISQCYLMMEKSEFWKARGFDFTNVAVELPKKINSIRKNNGVPTFDHLTTR